MSILSSPHLLEINRCRLSINGAFCCSHIKSFSDCEIVKDMINYFFDSINSQENISSLSDLVTKLLSEKVKLNYENSFNAPEFEPTRVSIKDLNESIATKLNSVKLPLIIEKEEIIYPPSNSKFTTSKQFKINSTEYNLYDIFVHEHFPNVSFQMESNQLFWLPAYQMIFHYFSFIKEKLDSEQCESVVRKEFFRLFWAKETVIKFFKRLIQLYSYANEKDASTNTFKRATNVLSSRKK